MPKLCAKTHELETLSARIWGVEIKWSTAAVVLAAELAGLASALPVDAELPAA